MAEPLNEPKPSMSLAAVVVYGLLIAAGYGWLALRERVSAIPAATDGEIGLLASAAAGTAVGLGVSALLAAGSRYLPAFARLEQRLAELIGPLDDPQIWVLALCSGLGEEFFFRLAMQDALGPWPTAVVFALMHVGPKGFWLWTVVAFVLGVLFGAMVAAGLGLLSVTVAHALINYLSLQRMQSR